jgi:hypothetical protein
MQVTNFLKQWHSRRAGMAVGQTDGEKSDFILFLTRLKMEGALLLLSMTVAQRRSGCDGGRKIDFV